MNGDDIAFKYIRPADVILWVWWDIRGTLKGRDFTEVL